MIVLRGKLDTIRRPFVHRKILYYFLFTTIPITAVML